MAPGITTLIGESDAGKSAIFRALYWLTFNRPQGDGFVRHGKKSCSVTLHADGKTLVRKKQPTKNSYELDGQTFSAFGTGVPPEVSEFLRLGEVNFQHQLDPPFWLTLPATQVSRELNSIVDLSLIDGALSSASSSVKDTKYQVDECQRRVGQLETEAARTSHLDDLEPLARRIEGHVAELEELRRRRASLARDLARLRSAQENARRTVPDTSRADQTAKELRELVARKEGLCRLIETIRSRHERLAGQRDELSALQDQLQQVAQNCPTCGQPLPETP